MDLTSALVVVSAVLLQGHSAAPEMLVDEVAARTGVRWETSAAWPDDDRPVIWLGTEGELPFIRSAIDLPESSAAAPLSPEGYRLIVWREAGRPVVFVIGRDLAGSLFGTGRLLRTIEMTRGRIEVPGIMDVWSTPQFSLRGHQLGYRATPNSYDAWDLDRWEQYYRDLVVFGTNAVELVVPFGDASPLFPRPALEMIAGQSALADKYGLSVWVWYPATRGDYADPSVRDAHLRETEKMFLEMKRVDALFVPGGDPGNTHPRILMPFLKEQAEVLRRYHPSAKIWVSPQGYGADWMQEFVDLLPGETEEWFGGVVYGPGIRVPIAEFRTMIPGHIPIRSYPDITHTFHCQYPVPRWDRAFALTQGREPVNPRPVDQAVIFNLEKDHVFGWVTYSEGCTDDVNKMIWSALAWDPRSRLDVILEEYARYFIGPELASRFSEGLFGLERNWSAPLSSNESVMKTLSGFQAMERERPDLAGNWRWEMALYRAYYDAFIKRRLDHETAIEQRAIAALSEAADTGSHDAMYEAESVLREVDPGVEARGFRQRVHQLAADLFAHIGLQLSVERYGAKAINRGANLDMIDFPLNSDRWLREQFAGIRAIGDEAGRLERIDQIANWSDPGPGGFYDDLGSATNEPHLVRGLGFARDPGVLRSPADDFELIKEPEYYVRHPYRYEWLSRASTLHGTPLVMRYSGLDPEGSYKVRVVYPADRDDFVPKIRMTTDDGQEIHPFIDRPIPARPLEFSIPRAATSDGALDLILNREPIVQGNGRGTQIAEIWVLKDSKER